MGMPSPRASLPSPSFLPPPPSCPTSDGGFFGVSGAGGTSLSCGSLSLECDGQENVPVGADRRQAAERKAKKMTAQKPAFVRIEAMEDQILAQYIETLELDLKVKQEKSRRLKRDIQRHQNILEAARQEYGRRERTYR